jgi:general nucleoside transport system permease protein
MNQTMNEPKNRWLFYVYAYGAALAVAFLVTTAIIIALGHSPFDAYRSAFKDSLGSLGGIGQTLNRMTPLLLASITFTICKHAGLHNIGMDGQIYVGAIFATGLGLTLATAGLGKLLLPLLLVGGIAGGALWSGLAGALRIRWGVNEIFATVMLNFIALYFVEFLATGPWNDPMSGEAITYPVPRAATLPYLIQRGGAHTGILLAIAAAFGIWWLLYRTVPGYEIRSAGANARAARAGGISLGMIQLYAMLLGGAASGLAGAIEVAGVHHRMMLGLSPAYGMMSILIAVLARFHPVALIPANFALAVLIAGSDSLQRTVGFPATAVFMLQALIVLIVLGIEAVRARRERYVIG